MTEIGLQLDPKPKWLVLSEKESRFRGSPLVGTEQLLVGLMAFRECLACRALESIGLTLRRVQVELENMRNFGPGFVAARIPYSPRLERVFMRVVKIAREEGQPVNTGHLLLSILHDKDCFASRTLAYLKVDFTTLRRQVRRLLQDADAVNAESLAAKVKVNDPDDSQESEYGFTFDLFKQDVDKPLRFAEDEARKLKLRHITPDLLLFGVISEDVGFATQMLKSMNIALEDIRIVTRKCIRRKWNNDSPAVIPFSHTAMYVMETSWDEAKRLGQGHIHSGHLLISLFREEVEVRPDRILMILRQKYGLDSSPLRDALIQLQRTDAGSQS
jgi:ATP-dependent Clp protease ATP-binding subunit ClpA